MQNQWRQFLPDLPRATYILTLAQALNLTCAVISVTIAAIVGSRLAATPALATLPYGAQFASVMLCTYPASMLMRRYGRRIIFSFGAMMLIIAGILGYLAVAHSSFSWLIVSHIFLGIFIACANFYRFAAVDNLDSTAKPRAISLVVSGGVLAAIAGPSLSNSLRSVTGFVDFSLCYAAFCALGLTTLLLMAAWRPLGVNLASQTASNTAAHLTKFENKKVILVAIFCSASGYFIMNLLMVQASLVMKDICSFSATSFAIQAHVLAMFAPSFFTGLIIARIGLQASLISGFFLISSSIFLGVFDIRYSLVFTALALLGLGWNLSYVGGGALLAQSINEHNRHRWQGINDSVIAACATLGALLPAPMLTVLGWNWSNIVLAPICILGIALCWRVLCRRQSMHDESLAEVSEK